MSPKDQRRHRLLALLQRIWAYAITTKSDDARTHADEIAEAASKGYITTLVAPWPDRQRAQEGICGRLWKLTSDGTEFLFRNGDLIANQEETAYEAHCAD